MSRFAARSSGDIDRIASPIPCDELLEDLLSEPLHEVVESLPGPGLHEVVLAQRADPFPDVGREAVELVEPASGQVAEHPLQVRVGVVSPGRRALHPALEALALLGHDLLELAPDVAEHVPELVSLAKLLPTPHEPVHQVLEAGEVRARGVIAPPAAFHEAAEGLGDIALGHDVVGEFREDLVRVEVREPLGPVPSREPGDAHRWLTARVPVIAPATRSLLSRRARCRPSRRNSTAEATTAGSSAPSVTSNVAEAPDRVRQSGDLARPGHVLARRGAIADLDREARHRTLPRPPRGRPPRRAG